MGNPSKSFEFIRLYPKLSADPVTGRIGEIYYNTTTSSLKMCVNDSPLQWNAIGAMMVDSSTIDFTYNPIGGTWTADVMVNSLTDAHINTLAGIDATKIADGSVTNTEFQYISGLTSDAQTQLNSKLTDVVQDLTPQLGGDLDLNGKEIFGSLKHGAISSPTNFSTTDYYGPITLLDNTVNGVIFSYPATFRSAVLTFSIERNNDFATGRLFIANGSAFIVYQDDRVETNPVFIGLSAVITGANVEVQYTSSATGFDGIFKGSIIKF